jgi:hypothetical protein
MKAFFSFQNQYLTFRSRLFEIFKNFAKISIFDSFGPIFLEILAFFLCYHPYLWVFNNFFHNSQNTATAPHPSKSAKLGYMKQSKSIPIIEKLLKTTAKTKFSMGTKILPIQNERNVRITGSAPCDDNVTATFESVLWAKFLIYFQNTFLLF